MCIVEEALIEGGKMMRNYSRREEYIGLNIQMSQSEPLSLWGFKYISALKMDHHYQTLDLL